MFKTTLKVKNRARTQKIPKSLSRISNKIKICPKNVRGQTLRAERALKNGARIRSDRHVVAKNFHRQSCPKLVLAILVKE